MESIHFLNIIFVQLLGEKSTGPSKFSLMYIFRLKYFNLVLIPHAKSDGHRGTWTACTKIQQNLQGCTSTGLFLIKLQVYNRANASLKLYQKKQLLHRCFSVDFTKFVRKAFFGGLLWFTAFVDHVAYQANQESMK